MWEYLEQVAVLLRGMTGFIQRYPESGARVIRRWSWVPSADLYATTVGLETTCKAPFTRTHSVADVETLLPGEY